MVRVGQFRAFFDRLSCACNARCQPIRAIRYAFKFTGVLSDVDLAYYLYNRACFHEYAVLDGSVRVRSSEPVLVIHCY